MIYSGASIDKTPLNAGTRSTAVIANRIKKYFVMCFIPSLYTVKGDCALNLAYGSDYFLQLIARHGQAQQKANLLAID